MSQTILQALFDLQDSDYAAFQAKLTPTVSEDLFIGVRIPAARKLAKKLANTKEADDFINILPHHYYDENILHALLLSELRDYNYCIGQLNRFLPFVDNWAVCDIMSPKILGKNKDLLLPQIKIWAGSNHAYTCRFGIGMLMSHFLDKDFKEEYLKIAVAVKSEEYYVNMMIAWFLATALAKQWAATIPYLEKPQLSKWVHNKTIQKAKESYRITKEQKEYLQGLKL